MEDKKFTLKVIFSKEGEMVYFSQLDLVKVFGRALRRTNLPLFYTQGFSPHVRLSFGRALKLGVEGKEEVTCYFSKEITLQELLVKLSTQLPQGLKIIEIKKD
jgi:radical SAM-linked protein